jgi:ATP-dependent RNA helicase DDX54/DBP10
MPCSQKDNWHRKLGIVTQSVLDEFTDTLNEWHREKVDLIHTKEQSANAYKQYLKSRPGASRESLKRCKEIKEMKIGPHPVLGTDSSDLEEERVNFLEQMKNFKTKSTIFEIGNTSKNKDKIEVMNNKRRKHASVIEQNTIKLETNLDRFKDNSEVRDTMSKAEKSSEEEIKNTFDTIVKEAKSKLGNPMKDKSLRHLKDQSNFIPYQPADQHTEAGYSMMSGFSAQAHGAVLDLTGDDDGEMKRKKGAVVWDKKSKKYVKVQDDKKRIKTESGVYIAATYKTNRYARWKEKSKHAQQDHDSDGEGDNQRGVKRPNTQLAANHPAMKKARNAVPAHKKGPKNEVKRPEQILKKRNEDERKAANRAKGKGKGKGKGRKKR